jgi:hypothetical protein
MRKDAFTVSMSDSHAVQETLRFALEIQPILFSRPWRLLRFHEPMLLTSDNPVGLWSPALDGEQPVHGVGNARAIYVAIDRQTSLAMVTSGSSLR